MIDRLRTALADRYRIERELGAGGMATVYLADDLKHQRQVAIKVLRSELAAVLGAERFLAEIETTANLQHPHILPLFDSGEAGGLLWYAMPYISGESLRERLEREHQLPVAEAVRIASDVAEALHAAHERGVIHRDIKPANILLSGGRPLVADFGIALAVSNAGGGRLTETGLSLGTPYYMSPEQASADRDPSPQSDQYSLACVLYEMLVGEPPFPGGSAQAVLARILTQEPTPPSQMRRSVPAHVDAVVMRGLEKLPADRFSDTREMVRALRDEAHRYTGSTGAARTTGGGVRGVALLPWALALILAVVAGLGLMRPAPQLAGLTSARVAIPIDTAAPLPLGNLVRFGSDREIFDVAPDGSTLVHVGWDGDQMRLYLRPLDSFETTALPGTEGASDPFFSPDGRWIGYFAQGGLWKVPTAGGESLRLASAPNPAGGSWDDTDRIWYSVNEGAVLMSVAAAGGDPRLEDEGGQSYATPRILPEGAGLLMGSDWPGQIAVRSAEGERRVLTTGRQPQAHPAGYLTFVRGRTLYAAGFDAAEGALTTTPVPVLEGIRAQGWIAGYRLGADGTLYYLPGENANLGVPVLVTPGGATDTLPMPRGEYGHLAISPDLGRIATFELAGEFELVVFDLSSRREQLLDRASFIQQAIWSRSGDRIAYTRSAGRGQPWEIVVRSPASTEESVVHAAPEPLLVSDWTPDDTSLVFTRWTAAQGGDLYTVGTATQSEPTRLIVGPSTEWGGVVSPNGGWIAYTSDRTGGYAIYLMPYPDPAGSEAVKVSVHPNAEEPHWSPDGDAIVYRADGRWWRVPLAFALAPVPGTPELVTEGSFINVPGKSWDLLPDGRLLVLDGPRDQTVDRIHMIPGFLSEIEARIAEANR